MPVYGYILLAVGIIAYLPGFLMVYSMWMRDFNATHPMAYSRDYRMTDGHFPGAFSGLMWPFMALGVGVRNVIAYRWPKSKPAQANAFDCQMACLLTLFMAAMLAGLVYAMIFGRFD